MKAKIRYVRKGETVEVRTNMKTAVMWERKFKRKAADGQGLGYDDLCFLAYEASKQAGVVVPAVYDDFIDQLEELDVIDNEPSRPTEGTPTEGD